MCIIYFIVPALHCDIILTVGLVSVIVSLQLLAYGTLNTVVFNYNNNTNSRSAILVPIENSYNDFLLVINSDLPPILHRFRDIAFDRSKIAHV